MGARVTSCAGQWARRERGPRSCASQRVHDVRSADAGSMARPWWEQAVGATRASASGYFGVLETTGKVQRQRQDRAHHHSQLQLADGASVPGVAADAAFAAAAHGAAASVVAEIVAAVVIVEGLTHASNVASAGRRRWADHTEKAYCFHAAEVVEQSYELRGYEAQIG